MYRYLFPFIYETKKGELSNQLFVLFSFPFFKQKSPLPIKTVQQIKAAVEKSLDTKSTTKLLELIKSDLIDLLEERAEEPVILRFVYKYC